MGEYKSRVPAMVAFEKDDEEKDLVVRELEEAVHKYIKTGVKSKQLDKVVDVEVKFQKGYKGCFDIERLIQTITSESKKEVLKNAQLAVTTLSSCFDFTPINPSICRTNPVLPVPALSLISSPATS